MASKASDGSALQSQLGHSAVKSGPLCVTSSKLVSQKMVLDHLLAHYKKVTNAKSAIDNKPPQSMLMSTKVRDRLRRETVVKSSPRARSAATARSAQNDQQPVQDSTDYAADNDASKWPGSSTLDRRVSNSGSVNAVTSKSSVQRDTARSNSALARPASGTLYAEPVEVELPPSTGNGSARRGNSAPQSADILDKRPNAFKPGGDFTPRTLNKDNSQSWLAKSKFYTPPKKRQTRKTGDVTDASANNYGANGTYDYAQDDTEAIPPLNISVDDDKMRWLHEQARLAGTRKDAIESYDGKLGAQDVRRSTDVQLRQSQSYENADTLRRSIEAGSSGYKTFTGSNRQSKTMAMLSKEEEELRYLEFVSDVTNDIVSRGVYTNSALNQIFEYHLQKRKDVLKISRMRSMLDGLRDDLGIPLTDEDVQENYGYASMPDKSYQSRGAVKPRAHTRLSDTDAEFVSSTQNDSEFKSFNINTAASRHDSVDNSPVKSSPARTNDSPARRGSYERNDTKSRLEPGKPNLESTRADAAMLNQSVDDLGSFRGNQTADSTMMSTQQSQHSEVGLFTMTMSPSRLHQLMTTDKQNGLSMSEPRKSFDPLNGSKDNSVQGTPQRRNSASREVDELNTVYATMKLYADEPDADSPMKPSGTQVASSKSVTFAEKPEMIGTASLMESFDLTRVSELGGTSQSNALSETMASTINEQEDQLGVTNAGNRFGNPGMTGKFDVALNAGNPGMTGKPDTLPHALDSKQQSSTSKDDEDEATYAEDFDEEA